MRTAALIFVALLVLAGCTSQEELPGATDPRDTIIRHSGRLRYSKLLNLDYGFFVKAGRPVNHGSFQTYQLIKLARQTGVVLIDSSLNYHFSEKIFPMVISKPEDRYEILLEVNNSPGRDYLNWLFIESDQLLNTMILPMFVSDKADINGDGHYEFAGFSHHHETVIRDGRKVHPYNPLLYYRLTDNGLVLDSALTIERNTRIYGEFFGFRYDPNIETPAAASARFDEEVQALEKAGGRLLPYEQQH